MKKILIQSLLIITVLLNQAIAHGADTDSRRKHAGRDNQSIHLGEITTADASLNVSGMHNENESKKETLENTSPDPAGADKSGREYLGLFGGYGGHFPVADYGARFRASHLFSCALGIYALNLRGISPELHFRYTDMKSEHGRFMYDSSMKLTQFFPGLVYRHHFNLPHNTLNLYGRVWDGFCRIEYRSANPYFVFMKERIVEYVNIFGLSAGCYYDLFHGILIGADFSYSIAFTAGKPLQSVAVTLNAGYRIL